MKTLFTTLLAVALLTGCASTKLTPAEKEEREQRIIEMRMHRSFR